LAEEEKTSKVKDIKGIVSGAVEIMRQVGTPHMQESFDNIMDTAVIAKSIIEDLKTPEMVKNIENFRLISENMNQATAKMQETLKQLEETGIINETKGFIKSAKNTIDSFGGSTQGSINGQDLHEVSTAIKEMLKSIRSLVDELRITVEYSKKSGTVYSIQETFREASDIYKTTL
jgi:hypothetical protein